MRVPPQFTTKLEKIKNIILSRSGLLSEYGPSRVKIEVEEIYETNGGTEVLELVFSLRLNNIDCDECDFEPRFISEKISEIRNRLDTASEFYISPTLELKSSKSSLRGVLFYDCKIWRGEFEQLTFGIFYDVGVEY
jgi:hypothetical protein